MPDADPPLENGLFLNKMKKFVIMLLHITEVNLIIMGDSFEKPLLEQEAETSQIVERFGDSLTILGTNERVQRHLKDLEKLPHELVRFMREKGLRVVVGEGNIIDLLSKTPGVKAFIVSLIEKFLNISERTLKMRPLMPLSVYYQPLKTAFVSDAPRFQRASVALHEYGHGLGHLLKLNKSRILLEQYRMEQKLHELREK